jgi:Fe-S-cluster-containing dehydrogenase component
MGFFTDTSVHCKACEVACKEWNNVPEDGLRFIGESYDNTSGLSASTWRHVAFIEEQLAPSSSDDDGFRWLMASDVCKPCPEAACLDVCPTGALVRTAFGTVVVQQDICNGCDYCVPACPFGVIDRRERDGRAGKARFATTAPSTDSSRPAPRPARPSRFSSASWTSFGPTPRIGCRSCVPTGSRTPSSPGIQRTTASADRAPSSCCSTNRRPTDFRPIPPFACGISARRGAALRWPPARCSVRSRWPSWGAGNERHRAPGSHLVLRSAGRQGPGVDLGGPGVFLRRRSHRSQRNARPASAARLK